MRASVDYGKDKDRQYRSYSSSLYLKALQWAEQGTGLIERPDVLRGFGPRISSAQEQSRIPA